MVTAPLAPVRVGIENVLIATDFSRYSNAALEYGLQLSKDYQASAYVVSVLPTNDFLMAGPDAYLAAKEAALRDLAQLKSDLKDEHAYAEGKDYHLYLLEGEVAQAILNFAQQKQADVIVVGTHGRGGLGKALMGSVAERVFRSSTVPVLTLGPGLRSVRHSRPAKTIMVAADLTRASEQAVAYAASLAREHNAKLTTVHVLHDMPSKELERAKAVQVVKTRLAELLGREAQGVRCSLQVESGRIVPMILEAAEEANADLLVIGVRPSSGVLDRVMFPHAYQIVCESPCPVLTLREKPAEHD